MSRPPLFRLVGFARDARGAAAIELAMIAPIIAGIALISFGVWERGGVRQDARAALDVAAQYYMNGGGNDATAQTLANQAWRNKPGDGAISTSRSYRCGTAAAADASTICSGGRTSAIYVAITATGTDSQTLGSGTAQQLNLRRTVRVR